MRLRDRVATKKLSVHSTHVVTVDGVPFDVELMRPTAELRERMLRDAITAKEIGPEGKPNGVVQSQRFAARVLAGLLYEDGEQAFPGVSGPGEVMRLDEFDALSAIAQKAITGEPMGETQGNSEALVPQSIAGEG